MREQLIDKPSSAIATTALDFASDLLGYAGRDGRIAVLLVIAGALLEGVGLVMLIPIFSIIAGGSEASGAVGTFGQEMLRLLPATNPVEQLLLLLSGFAALMALRAWVLVRRDVLLARLLIGFIHRKRLKIVRLLANSRWEIVARLRHGRITHILGSDIHGLRSAAHFMVQGGVAAVMLAAQIGLALLISPLLTVLVTLSALVAAATLGPVLRRSHQLGAQVTDANLNLVSDTTQFLSGLKLAVSQDLQQSFVREFDETLSQASGREREFARQRARSTAMIAAFVATVGAIVLLTGVALLNMSAPLLIALLVILGRMNGPATVLQSGTQQVLHSLPAYEKIRQLERELGTSQRASQAFASPPHQLAGPIEFKGVTYQHRNHGSGREGLFGLSLLVEEGNFIGLTGPSGAGKTTFADLLTGLYPPEQGVISVGGLPLDGETLRRWRASLSYVAQEPFLFHDSIRHNLLWARPDAAEDELWEALESVGAAAVVRRMEQGLETIVGERGLLLSGGERQRIALARALIRRPRMLLLDEATNAIDAEGEREILMRLSGVADRPTIILIAHRQSSLDLCERLIEFSGGVLVRDEVHHG